MLLYGSIIGRCRRSLSHRLGPLWIPSRNVMMMIFIILRRRNHWCGTVEKADNGDSKVGNGG